MNNGNYIKKLEFQIKESYGKVTYTYTTHLESMHQLEKRNIYLNRAKIVLSAMTASGVFSEIIINKVVLLWFSGLSSVILLAINLYFNDNDLNRDAYLHREASDKLWIIREKYLALLTDLNNKDINYIVQERDSLIREAHIIYSNYPKTNAKSYKMAQNKIKNEEYQFFSSEELDKMLPRHLHSDNKDFY